MTAEPREGRRLGPRFIEGLSYAADAHAKPTAQKAATPPYIAHLLSVAALVIEDGGTETQAIAALLHDAPEDLGGATELAKIEARLGGQVAGIVAECSDTFETPKPAWRPRKERYLVHLEHASPEALQVSLADKLDNARAILRDFRTDGHRLWERFTVKEPSEHLWYYRSLNKHLQAAVPDERHGPGARSCCRQAGGSGRLSESS